MWLFGCLMPLSGISHGNPSRIPPRAGDGSAAPAGWGGGRVRWFPSPAVVSATFPVPRLSQPLQLFEYAFMHICCLRGLLVGKFLLGIADFDVSILILCFHLVCYAHQVHKQLSLEMSNSHELFPKFPCCKMEFGSYWKSVFSLWLMNAGISSLLIRSYFREINPHQKTKLYVYIVWILCDAVRFW